MKVKKLVNNIKPHLLLSIIIISFISQISFCQNKQNDASDLRDSLWDNYYAYGFFFKAGYTSDIQYRGYKGAVIQRAYIPGLLYNHPNGIGLFINAYNISETTVPWDEFEYGASYTHTFGESFTMSMSYTHYAFNDSSDFAKQGLTGLAGLNLSYEFAFLTAGGSIEVGFGDQTDYSFSISISKKLILSKKDTYQVSMEPEITGIYGTESLLNELVITRGNGKNKATQSIQTSTNKVLSVLDYQISFPLSIEIGRFTITPEYDYSFPLNQPPFTDSNDFGFVTLNISMKIF